MSTNSPASPELKQKVIDGLKNIIDDDQLLFDEPLSKHTTFEIGGPADLFVMPKNTIELVDIIKLLKKLDYPYFVLGSGSDLLVDDRGYRGAIICTAELMAAMFTQENELVAQAGCTLKDMCELACFMGLGGLEFACGIPGSLGGACFMNAGAYDGQMSDVLKDVQVLTPEGFIESIPAKDLNLGYRQSRIKDDGLVVLEATLTLQHKDPSEIRALMDDLTARREDKQPLELPSAGSTFKRPEGYFAGKLIQDAGLQGFKIGGAQVSTKHAGFVVNVDHASAADVIALIRHIQGEVKNQFGVDMYPEVRYLGEYGEQDSL